MCSSSDPYADLSKNLKSAFYVGQSIAVGGVKTEMIAIAGDDAAGQIWLGAEDHLPRKIAVVYAHEPAHALYQTEFSNWKLGEKAEATAFASEKAAKAKRIQFAPPGAPKPPVSGQEVIPRNQQGTGVLAMKKSIIATAAALALAVSLQPANAFFRGGGGFGGGGFHGGGDWGGGGFHAGDAGGFDHATVAGPNGAAHVSDAGGYWHGTAVGPNGAVHGSDYGGYYHGTAVDGAGVYHTGGYGAYYHQPVVVNSYGAYCAGCGAAGWGAAAVAGAAVAGAAVASASYGWPVGATYGYLPAGCSYNYIVGQVYYSCGAGWLQPAYGANGLYYRVVPAP